MSDDPTPSPSGTPTSKHHEEKSSASPIGTPTSTMPKTIGEGKSPLPTGETVEIRPQITSKFIPPKKYVYEPLALPQVIHKKTPPTKHKMPVSFNKAYIEDLHYPKTTPPDEWHEPRVAVNILTLLRPVFLNQCLESISKFKTPFQIFIVNQGDNSIEQRKVIDYWVEELGAIEHFNDPPKWPGPARAEAFTLRQREGYELIVTFDDDCKLIEDGINELVKAADAHPEFHAISGCLIAPRRRGLEKYMLGGKITPTPNKYHYKNYEWMPRVHETDYICNGFRLVRLNPLILPDREYTIGLTDFDWSAATKNRGLRLAVCGEAVAYHKVMFEKGKPFFKENPIDYHKIRRNRSEIMRMRDRFQAKWNYRI